MENRSERGMYLLKIHIPGLEWDSATYIARIYA
jgi:hypothetical protein